MGTWPESHASLHTVTMSLRAVAQGWSPPGDQVLPTACSYEEVVHKRRTAQAGSGPRNSWEAAVASLPGLTRNVFFLFFFDEPLRDANDIPKH